MFVEIFCRGLHWFHSARFFSWTDWTIFLPVKHLLWGRSRYPQELARFCASCPTIGLKSPRCSTTNSRSNIAPLPKFIGYTVTPENDEFPNRFWDVLYIFPDCHFSGNQFWSSSTRVLPRPSQITASQQVFDRVGNPDGSGWNLVI